MQQVQNINSTDYLKNLLDKKNENIKKNKEVFLKNYFLENLHSKFMSCMFSIFKNSEMTKSAVKNN